MSRLILLFIISFFIWPNSTLASVATGDFLVGCPTHTVSHDDPIRHFGEPGVAHEHTFAGGNPVDAFTTFGQLAFGNTSCVFPGNKTAVWSPSIETPLGMKVHPTFHNLYYRANSRESSTLFPLPMGLQHVREDVTGYRCLNSNITRATIPTDCGGAGIEMSTYFPQCWTGHEVTGDPLGPCDSAHPVNVPQIQVLTVWPPEAVGGHVDPAADHMHVDYMMGWNPYAMDDVMRRCLLANRKCRVRSTGEVYDFSTKATLIPAGTYQ
jgi:hypothetical protein